MEHPTFRSTPKGELILKASQVAQRLGRPQAARVKKPEEVKAEARARVVSEEGDPGN